MKLKAFFFEILPITTFFIIAQYQSIISAALISSLFSLMVLITFYFVEKRIAKFQIFSITLSGLLSVLAFIYNEEINDKVVFYTSKQNDNKILNNKKDTKEIQINDKKIEVNFID